LAVFDLSFISLTLVLPAVMAVLHPDHGQLICLIKPQFELRREDVGPGGIIRDPALHQQAIDRISRFVQTCNGWHWRGCIPSPITGTDGNVEFLAWVSRATADL
jgi:23S rRNA (cytidine1920-2'-O)/16S rRNA (cytidine1409-2'-O)-methyltransferase